MSHILFVMGMGMVTRTAQKDLRPRKTSYQEYTQLSTTNQRFMEDIKGATTNHIQTKWALLVSTDYMYDASSKREYPFNNRNSNLMLGDLV